jgi:drug/metabolite transporter (DMT)-like permease
MLGKRARGYIEGVIASVSYGLNPLFALPLYATGMLVDSVLFYRYAFAILLLAVMMKVSKQSFALKRNEILPLVVMGLLFSLSSLFLFQSFRYMDAGIASTILFVYPIIVAVIMAVFFKEKLSLLKMLSITIAFIGISLLYEGEGGVTLSLLGVVYVLLSSLVYALYIVGVNHSVLKDMPGLKLTFYAILFGFSIYVVRLRGGMDLQPLTTFSQWFNAFGLALFPTLISLVAITKSIHHIGSTPAAILGALEPLTALVVGVMVFDERLTSTNMVGIVMVLVSVTMIIVGRGTWGQIKRYFRHRLSNTEC